MTDNRSRSARSRSNFSRIDSGHNRCRTRTPAPAEKRDTQILVQSRRQGSIVKSSGRSRSQTHIHSWTRSQSRTGMTRSISQTRLAENVSRGRQSRSTSRIRRQSSSESNRQTSSFAKKIKKKVASAVVASAVTWAEVKTTPG